MLHANTEAQLFMIQARLDCKEIAFGQRVVPVWIEVRPFVRGETDTVT